MGKSIKLLWGRSSNRVLCSSPFNPRGSRYEIEPVYSEKRADPAHYMVSLKHVDSGGSESKEGVGSTKTQVKGKRLAERHFADVQARYAPAAEQLFWFDWLFEPGPPPSFSIDRAQGQAVHCQPARALAARQISTMKLYEDQGRTIAVINLTDDPIGAHLVAEVKEMAKAPIVYFSALRLSDGAPLMQEAVPVEVFGAPGRRLQLLSDEALAKQSQLVRVCAPRAPFLAFRREGPPLREAKPAVTIAITAPNGLTPIGF